MLRVGALTFGGGLSMLPQISRDFVDKQGWIDEKDMLDIFTVAQSLPGVVAVNAAILVGYRLAGYPGALIAALGAVLPSFLVLLAVTVFYEAFASNPYAAGALRGIRAAVTGSLMAVLLRFGAQLKGDVFAICVAVAALALALFTDINMAWLLLAGLLAGLVRFWIERRRGL